MRPSCWRVAQGIAADGATAWPSRRCGPPSESLAPAGTHPGGGPPEWLHHERSPVCSQRSQPEDGGSAAQRWRPMSCWSVVLTAVICPLHLRTVNSRHSQIKGCLHTLRLPHSGIVQAFPRVHHGPLYRIVVDREGLWCPLQWFAAPRDQESRQRSPVQTNRMHLTGRLHFYERVD